MFSARYTSRDTPTFGGHFWGTIKCKHEYIPSHHYAWFAWRFEQLIEDVVRTIKYHDTHASWILLKPFLSRLWKMYVIIRLVKEWEHSHRCIYIFIYADVFIMYRVCEIITIIKCYWWWNFFMVFTVSSLRRFTVINTFKISTPIFFSNIHFAFFAAHFGYTLVTIPEIYRRNLLQRFYT